jgi:hypothetical protein
MNDSNGKRNGTIKAIGKTHLATLCKSEYNRILEEKETKRSNEFCQYMKNYAFFRNITKKKLITIGLSFQI